MVTDYFGFLRNQWKLDFQGGRVEPVPEYERELASLLDGRVNQDGFIYPPMSRRWTLDAMTMGPLKEKPKSERPALLFKLPASHSLSLSGVNSVDELRREGPGAFVVHMLAYLFNTRLQFDDWWFDGRVPIDPHSDFSIVEGTAEDFLSGSFSTYRTWSKQQQRIFVNLLYMHSRAPSYEWDWERFLLQYMVLDACWRVANPKRLRSEPPHKHRISILCGRFGIPCDDTLVQNIVKLRNNLLHETLWDGSQPCTGVSSQAFLAWQNLRRLTQRLIAAILGYRNSYTATGWWYMGTCIFDKMVKP